MTQEAFDSRLAEKTNAISTLNNTLRDLQPKAAAHDGAVAELAGANKRADAAEGRLGRYQTLVDSGFTNPKITASIEAIHAAEMSGVAADKQVDLGTWLKGEGATHPVVLALKAPAPANPAGATGTPAARPANVLPPSSVGVGSAPAAATKLTPQQLQDFFASPAYPTLKPADRAVKRAELQAANADGPSASPV